MIRFFLAFAWLRWRLVVNGIRGVGRRDWGERLSRLLALVVPAFLALFLGSVSIAIGIAAFFGGKLLGGGTAHPENVLVVARFLLFATLALLVLIPAGSSASIGHKRLLLLPIPRDALHRIEVLASLADPWIVVFLPALLLLPLGLLFAGRASAASVALGAAGASLFLLGSMRALVSSLTRWLMQNRRRGELTTLVFVLGISLFGLAPMLLSETIEVDLRLTPKSTSPVERIDAQLPAWTRALPSELYASSIRSALDRSGGAGWLGVAAIVGEALALYALSAAAHRKLLNSTESGRRSRAARGVGLLEANLPGLSSAASAVALVQLRTALRSLRGRMALFLPGPTLAVVALVARRVPDEVPGGSSLASQGYALLGAQLMFTLYAMQAVSMNQLASDRAGLTLQFLAPISDLDLARGKAVGCGLFFAVGVAICVACSLAVAPGGSPLAWLAVLLGGFATYFLLSPLAFVLSAMFPRAADLSKTGNAGNPHALPFALGIVLVFVFALPPALTVGLCARGSGRPGLALALVLAWTAFAAAIALPALRLAARVVAARRENLALVAQGR